MTLTTSEARDAIIGLLDAGLAADPITTGVLRLYGNVVGDKPGEDAATGKSLPFMRLNALQIESPQITLARRRYQTEGIVTVQHFTPFGDGYALGDSYSEVILGIMRGHVGSTGGFWFLDMSAQEIGQDGPWFQTNVEATFRYQEVP